MAMQTVPVTPGEGLFAAVRQVTAPAGTAFIYDARLWHRACPELNLSESYELLWGGRKHGIDAEAVLREAVEGRSGFELKL